MKKLLLPIALLLLLSSCNGKVPKNERPDFRINSSVNMQYMQGDFSADVNTASDGTMSMRITAPEILKGITVVCGAEDISVHYGDLKLQCNDGYLPFTQLYKTVSFAKNSVPNAITTHDGEYIFEYSNGENKYVFVTDNQKNSIKRIETPVCVYNLR
ncbi:MAG: hypothetical protein MJ168_03715 [Clostridia bacterium]|nr:hypothetical protein [Clostridia bacterium]